MPVCVISTTGTSVFSQASKPIQEEWQAFSRRPDVNVNSIMRERDFDGYDLYLRTIEYLRAEARSSSAVDALRRASAELNSLLHILMSTQRNPRNDQLHFLASDTADGLLAARVISDFAGEYFGIEPSRAYHIRGLQVSNGRIFQLDGIRNLIGLIYDVLKHAPAPTYTRVINPTGGFKGVVPYLTLIGMIESDIQISYIYERSKELITLGRIPLQFNFDVLRDAYPALRACSEDFVDERQLKALLNLPPGHSLSEHAAWSLFDQMTHEGNTYFSVNGLGVIVLEHFKLHDKVKIYLSQRAARDFDRLDNTQQKKFESYFERLRDPQWIDANRHDEYANPGNAIAIKPGDVDERLFIYQLDDGSILVAELAFHLPNGNYSRVPQSRKDYDTYRLWEAN